VKLIPAAAARVALLDLSFEQLEATLAADGVRPIHARALWRAVHREGHAAPDLLARADFPPPLRRWLAAHLGADVSLGAPLIASQTTSTDGQTQKLLLRLGDGQEIETVVMGYPGRHTACVSTQAGCAMGCVFCATGQMGFARHLTPGEIVAQVRIAQRWLRERGEPGLRNLVLMGMGEPLHNYDATMHALAIVTDPRGVNLGPAHISVSTVGLVPGILRMAEERRPYNLAVSLHAATDEERSALLPANQRWPLAELLSACRAYTATTGRRIFFGWTLIEAKNDSTAEAGRLVQLLRGQDAHVNLIRLNQTEGYAGRTAGEAAARAFQAVLLEGGIPCTLRQRRGIDVDAGCGQLRAARARSTATARAR
jgi:23S rRNA (adenine2503-C2)-methyltransferase